MKHSAFVTPIFRLLPMLAIAVALAVSPARAAQVPDSFADLVEKLSPAVVNVATAQKVKNQVPFMGMPQMPGGQGDPFHDFFEQFQEQFGGQGGMQEREVFSLGSGFIIDPAGYVVTNNHVVGDADEITVILNDNTKLEAKIVGRDAKTDLALLKVESKKPLPYVKLGDSDSARVGDWVIAIGNPYGLGGTVTAGIISARARNINVGPFDDFLQTDAAINRGNSGGPMFNTNGDVIGINTAIFSPSGGNIGIGFALPSNMAQPIIEQLKAGKKIQRGWLGVKIQEVNDEIAESVGLKGAQGALVLDVTKDGPANKAGMLSGDVILAFDGKDIDTMHTLPRVVATTAVNKKVPVVVWRKGEKKTLHVTLGEMKEEETAKASPGKDEQSYPGAAPKQVVLGMGLSDLTPEVRAHFSLPENLKAIVVTDISPQSAAARHGVRYGDVITQVNNERIESVDQFVKAFSSAQKAGRKFALIKIVRGPKTLIFLTVPTAEK